jgi:hypothetical protein
VNFSHDGLTLWFGTPDAPAPFEGEVVSRKGVSLVVGVHPGSPINSVCVHFRRDGGFVETVAGREIRSDYTRNFQYFAVAFPKLVSGQLVEYTPVVRCAGRQAPADHRVGRFSSFFRLEA